MANKTHTGDDAKLKELILLLARKSEGDENFGAVKLNKELFYSDFLSYLHTGKAITGHEYIALERGPAPKYKTKIVDEMIKSGDLAVRKREAFSLVQDRAFALREPNLEKFTKDELQLIDHVLEHCHEKSGKDLSDMSHAFIGWRLAAEKEVIPYCVALVGTREPTLEEIGWGRELEPMAAGCLARNAATTAEA